MVNEMKPEEKFTRTVFGVILIGSFFFSWGRYAALILGILFMVSVLHGFCATCAFYRFMSKLKK